MMSDIVAPATFAGGNVVDVAGYDNYVRLKSPVPLISGDLSPICFRAFRFISRILYKYHRGCYATTRLRENSVSPLKGLKMQKRSYSGENGENGGCVPCCCGGGEQNSAAANFAAI